MKNIGQLASVALAVTVCGFASIARTQAGAPAASAAAPQNTPTTNLTPERARDAQLLAQATDRGTALLKSARWQAPLPLAALQGRSGQTAGTVSLFDAGDVLIWWPSRFAAAVAVDKATGKTSDLGTSSIMALAVGDNGGEILMNRSTQPRNGAGTYAMELIGTPDHSRWMAQAAPNSDTALIAGKQIFTAPSVPGLKPGPLPPGGEPLVVTTTYLTLEIWAHDRGTGAIQWSYALPAGTLTAQLIACTNGVLYLQSKPGAPRNTTAQPHLLALDATTGKLLFDSEIKETLAPFAARDGQLLAISRSGELVGLDAGTGKESWREPIWLSLEPEKVMLAGLTELRKPVLAGDTILVQVHAGSAFTGDNRFILQNHTAGLAAFDARTHKQLWFFRPPEGTPTGTSLYLQDTPPGNGEIVAATSGSSLAYLGIDPKTGKLDWLIPVANENSNNIKVITPPVVSNGILYVVNDSKLLAIPLNAK